MQPLSSSRSLQRFLMFLLVAVTPFLPFSGAMAQARTLAVADVPFPFVSGDQTLPAGRYQVVHVGDNIVALRSADGRMQSNAMTNPVISLALPNRGKLVFRRYANRYFIAQLWVGGTPSGIEFLKTRAEKEMLSTMLTAHPSNTEIALNTVVVH